MRILQLDGQAYTVVDNAEFVELCAFIMDEDGSFDTEERVSVGMLDTELHTEVELLELINFTFGTQFSPGVYCYRKVK